MPAPVIAAVGESVAATEATYAAQAANGASKAEAAAGSNLPNAASAISRMGRGSAPVDTATASGRRKANIHDIWAWQSVLSQAQATASGYLPRFQHTIAVTVLGGPRATLKSIWQLALATVFGRYRQSALVGSQTGSIECTWDITEKSVAVKLFYENNGLVELVQRGPNVSSGKRRGTGGIGQFLATGPSGETVGGPFVSWLDGSPVSYAAPVSTAPSRVIGGVKIEEAGTSGIVNEVSAKALKLHYGFVLPDDGRVITTEFKDSLDVQPPRPEYDHISRTLPYIALVSNALTSPGFLPASPPTNKQKEKRSPKRIYTPGNAPGTELQNKKFIVPELFPQETSFEGQLERKFTSLDGYPILQKEDEVPDVKGEANNGL